MEDGRIQSLLQAAGAQDRAIKQGEDISKVKETKINYDFIRPRIEEYREHSLYFLQSAIQSAL